MTRALVTQMLNAMDKGYTHAKYSDAITAAREYLATEPSGERADSAQWLREFADMEFSYYSREATQLRKAADMLEADAQQRSKPHGHCTHQKCREIWSAYLEATEKLSKYEPGATMHLNDAQQIKEMFEAADGEIQK